MTPFPDRYFVLGHPVAHSQSPFIHNAFAQQTGQSLIYDRRECPMDGFEAAVRMLAADTQGGPVRGCNVTVPFKFEVPRLAARVTPRAALAQAANVLCFDGDGWLADNTDGIGLMRDLQQGQGFEMTGRHVLLIGAGGAGAGVLGPLIETRPDRIRVVNRSEDKAVALAQRHAALAGACAVRLQAGGLQALAAEAAGAQPPRFDLIINASASSMAGAPSPIPAAVMVPGAEAVDLMYGPASQPFLHWAREQGASRAVDGLGMLVEQAAEAFERWRGVKPQTAPVLAALRQKLASAA
jgi:shikimate dehydrogenase